jgi:hypothetical protein
MDALFIKDCCLLACEWGKPCQICGVVFLEISLPLKNWLDSWLLLSQSEETAAFSGENEEALRENVLERKLLVKRIM